MGNSNLPKKVVPGGPNRRKKRSLSLIENKSKKIKVPRLTKKNKPLAGHKGLSTKKNIATFK